MSGEPNRQPNAFGLNGLSEQLKGWSDFLSPFRSPEFVELMARVSREGEWANRLGDGGWLPHYTTPFRLIGGAEVPATVAAKIVAQYYADHWPTVEDAFRKRISGYLVDEEAIATFHEALIAHGAGLYRVAPRLLFPEVERVARAELLGAKPKKTKVGDALREAVGIMTPRMLEPAGSWSLHMVRQLDDHFYAFVGDEVARFAALDVPNRHASVHGLVSYASPKSSLNALIFADFALKIVSVVKEFDLLEVD